jgi:hypothetical protein
MPPPEIITEEWVDDQVPKDKGVEEMTGLDADEIALGKEYRMRAIMDKIMDTKIRTFNKQDKLEKEVIKSTNPSPDEIEMFKKNKLKRYTTTMDMSRTESSDTHLPNGHSSGDSEFIEDVIKKMEIKGSAEELRLLAQTAGKIAAATFRKKNGGLEPTKQVRPDSIGYFCAYSAQYKPMLEEAVTQAISAREEGAVKAANKRKRDDEIQLQKDQQPSMRKYFISVGVDERDLE